VIFIQLLFCWKLVQSYYTDFPVPGVIQVMHLSLKHVSNGVTTLRFSTSDGTSEFRWCFTKLTIVLTTDLVCTVNQVSADHGSAVV